MTEDRITAAVERLSRCEKGRNCLTALLALLEDARGCTLDDGNQQAVVDLFLAANVARCRDAALESIRQAVPVPA